MPTAGTLTAKGHLEAALSEFARLGMPFETARTRLLIAQALRELDPEVARSGGPRRARRFREPWREGRRRHRHTAA